MRYPLEVAAAIREVWPRHKALGMRITGTDWVDGGITPDETGKFTGKLSDIGFDYARPKRNRCRRPCGLRRVGARVSRRPALAWHAAAALGANAVYPPQYLRAGPEQWPGAALTRYRPAPGRR